MKAYQTPTSGQEWMSQVNRRLALIERHRHGAASANVGPEQQAVISQWFAYGGLPPGSRQYVTADAQWFGITYPTLIYDATGMFDGTTITAPRDGYLRVTATASVLITSGGGTGLNSTIGLFDQTVGVEYARGNQTLLTNAGLSNGEVSIGLIVDSVIKVTAGQKIVPALYVDCSGRGKYVDAFPLTYLYGEYVDQPTLETALVSADAGNAAILGTDSLVYVPQQQGATSPWIAYPVEAYADDGTYIVPGTGGSISARYKMIAPYTMALRIFLQWGGGGGNGGIGPLNFQIPSGYATAAAGGEQILQAKTYMPNSPVGNGSGFAYLAPDSPVIHPFGYTSGANANQIPWQTSGGAGPVGWYPNGNGSIQGVIEVNHAT